MGPKNLGPCRASGAVGDCAQRLPLLLQRQIVPMLCARDGKNRPRLVSINASPPLGTTVDELRAGLHKLQTRPDPSERRLHRWDRLREGRDPSDAHGLAVLGTTAIEELSDHFRAVIHASLDAQKHTVLTGQRDSWQPPAEQLESNLSRLLRYATK